MDITFEHANARANYWTCRIAMDDIEDIEAIESELKELAQILSRSGLWHERKPLILLAKIEEQKGNIEEAINFIEKAIESSNNYTRFPEEDGEYLKKLWNKRNNHNV